MKVFLLLTVLLAGTIVFFNEPGARPGKPLLADTVFAQGFGPEFIQGKQEADRVIQSGELAFRMQREMPEVLDLVRETANTQKDWGIGSEQSDEMGRKCLLARRMIEAGVRVDEITHGNGDHHFNLDARLRQSCDEVDQPIAALTG